MIKEMVSLFDEDFFPVEKKKGKRSPRLDGRKAPDVVCIDLFGVEVITAPEVAIEKPVVPETEIVPEVVESLPPKRILVRFKLDGAKFPRFNIDARYQENIKAIRLLKTIEEEGRSAHPDEKQALSLYSGWGGIPKAFDKCLKMWDTWYAKASDLKALLSDAEYEEARSSCTTAFFTPPWLCRFIWDGLARLGFKGGKVLEPSCGIGYFLGSAPDDIAERSVVTAIEKDDVTGRMTKLIYPEAKIHVNGFEEEKVPSGYYDAVIGNVPFGDFKLHDPEYSKYNLHIHNYFMVRCITDLVRPGGLAAFVVPLSFLNGKENGAKARKLIAQKADLVAAYRLPTSVFLKFSGTDTAVDVVFFRRRLETEEVLDETWLETIPKSVVTDHREAVCFSNRWVEEHHDEVVFGKEGIDCYGGLTIKNSDIDVESELYKGLFMLPENIYRPREARNEAALTFKKGEGSFVVVDGRIAVKNLEDMSFPEYSAKDAVRLCLMAEMRDITRKLLEAQYNDDSEDIQNILRKKLNEVYTKFIFQFGYLSLKTNRTLFAPDPDAGLLLALEEEAEPGKYAKAAIFTRRTIRPFIHQESAATAKDALLICLAEIGRVDLDRICSLYHKDQNKVIEELVGLIYLDPATESWQTAVEYLSGNVKTKLSYAKKAAEDDLQFQENVTALESVIPPDLPYADIDARLGAPWIPVGVYEAFTQCLIDIDAIGIKRLADGWEVNPKTDMEHQLYSSVANTREWGTVRAPFIYLIECALNSKLPDIRDRVTDADGKEKYVLNPEETAMARAQLEKVKDKFRQWIWDDEERRHSLARLYNDKYNNIRVAEYDGSHLTMPGMAEDITLRMKQKNAVWRILSGQGNALLAHEVGVGKTWTMQCAAMEMRRMGLANKPLLTVPGANIADFILKFRMLYPNARILSVETADIPTLPTKRRGESDEDWIERRGLIRAKRQQALMQIATGDWDAVIMTHEVFRRLPVSPEWKNQFIKEQIAEIDEIVMVLDEDKRDRSATRIVKQLEKRKARLKETLLSDIAEEKKDIAVPFEDLGIDLIEVDEADSYKNLTFSSKMSRVAGVQNSGSERSMDLFMKIRWLSKTGKKVVFATGTPISNTIAEMYTLMRYMCYDELKERGIVLFDDWAATFGETINSIEKGPDGSWRTVSRFANFINAPELIALFRSFADVVTAEDANIPRPEIEGEKRNIVSCKPSVELKQYIGEEIRARIQAIRNRTVDPSDDNMLKVSGDLRRSSLDMRLIRKGVPLDPEGKLFCLVDNVASVWRYTAPEKAAQVIFCDMGIPKAVSSKGEPGAEDDEPVSIYHDIKQLLIERGIPEREIAFIHDAATAEKREVLFQKVRVGQVRVILGSTQKLGVGVNIQDRLFAAHHLDCPWRPRDLEQREGRIRRQGNFYNAVRIYVYVTEDSADSWMWQIVKQKARFINQVLKGDLVSRTIEDVENTVLSYAEIEAIATGNPRLIEKFKIDSDIERMLLLKTKHQSDQYRIKDEMAWLPKKIDSIKRKLDIYKADIEIRKDTSGDNFSICLQGVTYTNRKDADEDLTRIVADMMPSVGIGKMKENVIGSFAGFQLLLAISKVFYDPTTTLTIKGRGEYSSSASIASLEYTVRQKPEKLMALDAEELSIVEKKLRDLTARVEAPFEQEALLADLQKRQKELNEELGIKADDVIMDSGSSAA